LSVLPAVQGRGNCVVIIETSKGGSSVNYQIKALAPGLYFVGVPIGTARDITLRALDVLASADVLAAEDTRSLRKLMEIHGVPLNNRRIVALHDHTGRAVQDKLVEAVSRGQSVAYASEAGMPLIADPGFELSRAAVEAGVNVTCAPGPSAVLTALALAGLPTDAFFFAGFLPNAKSARLTALQGLRDIAGTLRNAVVCRELTKKFEEIQRGTLEDLSQNYAGQKVKGEIVVLIDRGRSPKIREVHAATSGAHVLSCGCCS